MDRAARRGLSAIIERLMSGDVQVALVTHQPEDRLPCITHTLWLDRGRVLDDPSDPEECDPGVPREAGPSPARCLPTGR